MREHKLRGFTLAEVLITLGVIGVVAAMTIPVLISKHNENVTMTKLKKFYSVMSQAQIRAITDYGEISNWDWGVDNEDCTDRETVLAWFNKYFTPYLSNIEIIDNNESNEGILVRFADGSVLKVFGFSGGYMHMFYYTDYKAFINNSTQDGINQFWFGLFNRNLNNPECNVFHPYICQYTHTTVNTENNLKNNSKWGCYSGSNGKRFCARLLMKNGWKAPKDYPFKF